MSKEAQPISGQVWTAKWLGDDAAEAGVEGVDEALDDGRSDLETSLGGKEI